MSIATATIIFVINFSQIYLYVARNRRFIIKRSWECYNGVELMWESGGEVPSLRRHRDLGQSPQR